MRPRKQWAIPPRLWYTIASGMVAVLLLVGLGSWWIDRQGREADRRWCELLVTMDDAYGSTPPQTELGRRIAASMHRLRTDFGC